MGLLNFSYKKLDQVSHRLKDLDWLKKSGRLTCYCLCCSPCLSRGAIDGLNGPYLDLEMSVLAIPVDDFEFSMKSLRCFYDSRYAFHLFWGEAS